MSEWKECKLGDVCTKIGSGATPLGGENSYKLEGISFIRSQNVHDFKFENEGLAFIDEKQAADLGNVEVFENDILINITGESVTRCCIVPKNILPARVNQHVSIIRPIIETADYRFIFYFFQSIKPELHSLAEIGCTRRALTKNMLENLEALLPPLPEQRAIAGVLSSIDDKIDLLHRQNKTLEAMAETLFRQWFVEEADEEWEEGRISALCTTITKGTTPTTLGHAFTDSGINFIKAESITDIGNFIWDKFAKISLETHEFLGRSIIRSGDILCSIAGTIGRIAIAVDEILPANTNQAIAIIRVNPEKCFLEFIYLFLKSTQFREIMDGKIVHAVQPNLSLGEIGNTPINIPSKVVLSNFKNIISPLFIKKNKNTCQIHMLEKLHDILLPKMMSGEVRVLK